MLIVLLQLGIAEDLKEDPFNPKSDKALLEKIKNLPENTWLKLPKPTVTGEISWLNKRSSLLRDGPRVRDYCNKIVYAPERKRGVYCGAGHNVHPLNDVWEYDLPSNTWICLSSADPLLPRKIKEPNTMDAALERTKKIIVVKDGVVTTTSGGPVRMAHTWWGLTYNSKSKRMVLWDAHKGLIFSNKGLISKAFKIDPKDNLLKGSGSGRGEAWLFEFDPESRKWTKVLKGAPKNMESSQLEYLPDSDSYFLFSYYPYLLGADRKEWAKLKGKMASNGAVSAYDQKSKNVVLVVKNTTWIFDANNKSLKKVFTGNDTAAVPNTTFCYDKFAEKFIMITQTKNKTKNLKVKRLNIYDLKTNLWTSPETKGDVLGGGAMACYYDVALNVTVLYTNAATWVYRCKSAK